MSWLVQLARGCEPGGPHEQDALTCNPASHCYPQQWLATITLGQSSSQQQPPCAELRLDRPGLPTGIDIRQHQAVSVGCMPRTATCSSLGYIFQIRLDLHCTCHMSACTNTLSYLKQHVLLVAVRTMALQLHHLLPFLFPSTLLLLTSAIFPITSHPLTAAAGWTGLMWC